MPTPTYIPLATVTLGSSAASVTFSSIPATFRDLVLVFNGTTTASDAGIQARLNSDTGSNYSFVRMRGRSAGAASDAATITSIPLTGGSTNNRAASLLQVMDDSATDKHKTALIRYNTGDIEVGAFAGRFANTAAVSTIQIIAGVDVGSTLTVGSTISLYGIAS